MQEPSFASAIAFALSSFSLALLGVEWFAIVWGFIGALTALYYGPKLSRLEALFFVTITSLGGAALGTMFVWATGTKHTAPLIIGSLIGGFSSQLFINLLTLPVIERIKAFLGGNGGEK